MFERIQKIVMDQLGSIAEEVKPEATLVQDLGADSLDMVELVMAIEEEFNIEIPDEATTSIKTVDDIVKYVEKQQSLQ